MGKLTLDPVLVNRYEQMYLTRLLNGWSTAKEVKRIKKSFSHSTIGLSARKGLKKAINRFEYLAK